MKTTDVKPHMIFQGFPVVSMYFTVESIRDGVAKGSHWGHFGPPRTVEFPVSQLADDMRWRYLPHDTFDYMARTIANLKDSEAYLVKENTKVEAQRAATLVHHEPSTPGLCAGDRRADILQERLDCFRKQAQEDFRARQTDLKRVLLYVDDAATGEYGYRDPEGHLCAQLLEKWGGGNASDPQQKMHDVKVEQDKEDPSKYYFAFSPSVARFAASLLEEQGKAQRVVSTLADALARGDLALNPDGSLLALNSVTVGGTADLDGLKLHTALGELSAVLWMLTSLALDHEPLCAIKQGGDAKCDCDKLIPDADPWATRVRAALQLPGKVQKELKEARDQAAHTAEVFALEKAAREEAEALSQKRCDRIKEFEAKLTPFAGELDSTLPPFKLTDAVVAYIEQLKRTVADQVAKLKARRVLQAKPIAGKTAPDGLGTVYEFELGDEKQVLVVVKGPGREMGPDNYRSWSRDVLQLIKKRFGPAAHGVVMEDGMELTLLELP